MKIKNLIFATALMFCIFGAFAVNNWTTINSFDIKKPQTTSIMKPNNYDYEAAWRDVEQLINKRLDQQALKKVREIRDTATFENNYPQLCRAFIYIINLSVKFEENTWKDEIKTIGTIADSAPEDAKAVLNLILGEIYSKYLNDNSFVINNRTSIENDTNTNIETWSRNRILKEIDKCYSKVLSNPEAIKKVNCQDWNYLISFSDNSSKHPTFYDFLAENFIKRYINNNINKEESDFSLENLSLLKDTKTFINYKPDNKIQESLENVRLNLYQDLLRFHKNDDNPISLIYWDLKRLKTYKRVSVNPDAHSTYLATLKSMYNDYIGEGNAEAAIGLELSKSYIENNEKIEAYNLANSIYKKYQNKYNESKECKNIVNTLETKKLSINIEENIHSKTPFPVKIIYTNIDKLYFSIYEINKETIPMAMKYRPYDLFPKLTPIRSWTVETVDNKDFEEIKSETIIDGLPIGKYYILASTEQNINDKTTVFSYNEIQITDLMAVTQNNRDNQYTILVLDRNSGKHIPNVKVGLLTRDKNWNRKDVFVGNTNNDGTLTINTEELCENFDLSRLEGITLTRGNDVLFMNEYFRTEFHNITFNNFLDVNIFTDRKIYRPGQTVYYKILIYKKEGNTATVCPDIKTEMQLLDVNRKVIANQEIITDEFGAAHGSFKIPVGLSNGTFTIKDSAYETEYTFSVEEYKKPTFTVTLNDIANEVTINSLVEMSGEAVTYSGTNIQNGKVNYKVKRIPVWRGWWLWDFDHNERIVATGNTTTDSEGRFTFKFEAKSRATDKKNDYLYYRYEVSVDVTDISGETRNATAVVSAGYMSMFLNTDFPSRTVLATETKLDSVKVWAETINGKKIETDIKIDVYKLKNYYRPKLQKLWLSGTTPLPGMTRELWDSKLPNIEYLSDDISLDSLSIDKKLSTHTTKNGIVNLSEIYNQGSGHYYIVLTAHDKQGREVKYERRATIIDPKGDIRDINSTLYLRCDKKEYQPGDKAVISVGSALDNVNLYYQFRQNDSIIKEGTMTIDHCIKQLTMDIEEANRGGLELIVFFVKDNTFKKQELTLDVPFNNKKLDIQFITFRDKLLPGQNEKWRIKITDFKNNPAEAQFMTTLYDESIDALKSNNWYFNIYGNNYNKFNYNLLPYRVTESNNIIGDKIRYNRLKVVDYIAPWFKWWLDVYMAESNHHLRLLRFTKSCYRENMDYAASPMFESRNMKDEADIAGETAVVEDFAADLSADDALEIEEETEDFNNVELRTNFAETAFFQPEIYTDKDGELYVEFVVPETITKWKMLGMAHTKNMELGFASNHLVTKKDFSVIPNLPRFLRSGDIIELPVKINNLSEKGAIKGQVKLEILDAEKMEPLTNFKITNALQNFDIPQNTTIAKKFRVEVPMYVDPIVVRVTAVSGNQSDGEQHIIPVLSDMTLVTEALTLSVKGNKSKQYEFKEWKNNNSKTAINHTYTLEYSSNPAWYAATSLPWLCQNPYECYEQTFSKIFGNSISALIIDNNPDIERIIKEWQESDSQILTSPLLKNQELKSMLIEETPWAIEGKNENDRMQKLSELLNRERINQENQKLLKKLEDGQHGSGAWPWFDGMNDSPCITQHITIGIGKMRHMGVKLSDQMNNMTKKAISYLDNEMVKYYEKWYKEEKNKIPDFYMIQFMYMHTFFPEYTMNKKTKEIYNLALKYCKENWQKFSLQQQSILCTTLLRTGDKDLSKEILNSLKDRAIESEEFGMYYKENVNGILFHEHNIETQALIIEAFQEYGMTDEVEELKIWLIKNRQANGWKTTKATTEACYAMMLCGTKLSSKEPLCKITLGNNNVDMTGAEVGTGYFKQQWQKDEIDIKMADIKIENPNNHISYGAVYRQYFEKLDKVEAANNKLSIEKQMYKISVNNKGQEILKQINEGDKIEPGDKVKVRFIIRTDRDLEYVHLKDMRASGFEPLNVLSKTKYQDGMFYYESTKDASENFFINYLNKGTYVFEYPLVAVHSGNFSNGIATIQCMYAPEFTAHSNGMRVVINSSTE